MEITFSYSGALVIDTDEDNALFLDLLAEFCRRKIKPRIVFTSAKIDAYNLVQGDLRMLKITDSQNVTLTIKPVDKKGNPAPVDGVPVWATSDDTKATVAPAVDGLSAVVSAVGPLGAVQISVSADADLGTGVKSITGLLDIEVIAGEAAALAIEAGAPVEQ